MKKQLIYLSICLILVALAGRTALSHAEMENYRFKKIKLGEYKIKNGFTASGTYSVSWLELQTSHVTFDDELRVYVLDKKAQRVLQFDADGKLINTIVLKDIDFSDKSEELGDDGYISYQIQVSSDGSYFYITEGGKENNWAIYNSNGLPIKKNVNQQWLRRSCDNNFKADGGLIELDQNLNVVDKIKLSKPLKKNEIVSTEKYLYSFATKANSSTFIVTKAYFDRKEMWKKTVEGKALRILGTDGHDNLYILVDNPLGIIKISSQGEKISTISLPKDSFFRDWRYVSFNVLCNGTIYCIPTYFALWKGQQDKERGEYYIYRFIK